MDNYFVRLLVTCITGIVGGHYYASNNIGKGLLYTFTFGFLGFGYVIDVIRTAFSTYNIFCPPHILASQMYERRMLEESMDRDYGSGYGQTNNVNASNVIHNVNINMDTETLRRLLAEKERQERGAMNPMTPGSSRSLENNFQPAQPIYRPSSGAKQPSHTSQTAQTAQPEYSQPGSYENPPKKNEGCQNNQVKKKKSIFDN